MVNVGMIDQDWVDVNTEKIGSSKMAAWTLIIKKREESLCVCKSSARMYYSYKTDSRKDQGRILGVFY